VADFYSIDTIDKTTCFFIAKPRNISRGSIEVPCAHDTSGNQDWVLSQDLTYKLNLLLFSVHGLNYQLKLLLFSVQGLNYLLKLLLFCVQGFKLSTQVVVVLCAGFKLSTQAVVVLFSGLKL
jgi:hypothetical protein